MTPPVKRMANAASVCFGRYSQCTLFLRPYPSRICTIKRNWQVERVLGCKTCLTGYYVFISCGWLLIAQGVVTQTQVHIHTYTQMHMIATDTHHGHKYLQTMYTPAMVINKFKGW